MDSLQTKVFPIADRSECGKGRFGQPVEIWSNSCGHGICSGWGSNVASLGCRIERVVVSRLNLSFGIEKGGRDDQASEL